MVSLILLIVAFVLFLMAAFGIAIPRVQILPLGLAVWVLASILAGRVP